MRQFAGTGMAKDVAKSAAKKCGEKCSEKCGEKRSEKRGEKFYRSKTAVWDLSRLFSFRPRDLIGNPLSRPLSRRSGNVAGSPSAQCNPLLNIMRLNVLKDFMRSILGAALIKTGTYHDML